MSKKEIKKITDEVENNLGEGEQSTPTDEVENNSDEGEQNTPTDEVENNSGEGEQNTPTDEVENNSDEGEQNTPTDEVENNSDEGEDTDFIAYEVMHSFKDLEDNNHIYKKGYIYPREDAEKDGYIPDKKRVKELMSKKNKIGEILIQPIESED